MTTKKEETKTKFNYIAITELSHMANLRNHLMFLVNNGNLSTKEEMGQLRTLIGKLDKEVIRRVLGTDLQKRAYKKRALKKAEEVVALEKESSKSV